MGSCNFHGYPADLATRGVTPTNLKDNWLWWNGPRWLQQSAQNWPHSNSRSVDETLLEIKPTCSLVTTVNTGFEDILRRYSSWPKALRIISFIFRFFNAIKVSDKLSPPASLALSRDEIISAKSQLIQLTQRQHFFLDYESLSRSSPVSVKSPVLTLNPFLDSQCIIRSDGRLTSSTLTFNERYPIILSYQAYLTEILIRFVHDLSLHGEIQLMIRSIRSEFWVPRLKNLVRKCIRCYKTCTIQKQKRLSQIMGVLPKERTTFTLPFTNTGTDFAGRFTLKTFHGRGCRVEKGYVCLFVCFCTRALHL